jgi:hypothetical protein
LQRFNSAAAAQFSTAFSQIGGRGGKKGHRILDFYPQAIAIVKLAAF